MNNPWKQLIKPALALLLVVIGCAIAARFLAGQETLAEYAAKNPEAAYGTSKVTVEKEPLKEQPKEQETAETKPAEKSAATASSEEKLQEQQTSDSGEAASKEETPVKNEPEAETEAEPETKPESQDEPQPAVDDSDVADARVTLRDGFYYEPVPEAVRRRMSGNSYPDDCPVSMDTLRYLVVRYVDFDDRDQTGEVICNEKIAQDLLEIFADLYDARYQLERVELVDEYGGDDDASMLANNTSCFNYRTVAGSTHLSRHAMGMAIDINPLYNPWINHGVVTLEEAKPYADRSQDFAHKIDKDDFCCQCFVNHGFFWGGNWNNPDYQHFQKD